MINEIITNTNTGTLSITAQASALASAPPGANAQADIQDLFHQNATDAGVALAKSSITQAITNNASLGLSVGAKATGRGPTSTADASAQAQNLFVQTARHVVTAAQSLTNTGSIGVAAAASASGAFATGYGFAGAQVTAGVLKIFDQLATGTAVASRQAHSAITQAITNSGSVTVTAMADAQAFAATGYGNSAEAAATIAKVFYQEAARVAGISQVLINSGALNLHATATAKTTGLFGHAAAGAQVSSIMDQQANGSGVSNATIVQSISNSGSLVVGALGKDLIESGDDQLRDNADISNVFYQKGADALSITQAIRNTGPVTLAATAKATNLDRGRTGSSNQDSALIQDVFRQSAAGSGIARGSASQSITNSASLTLSANANITLGVASVTGGGSTAAIASILNVFHQAASDAVSVTQIISNTGALSLNAAAVATALGTGQKAIGQAHIKSVLFQHDTGENLAHGAAAQTISNTGALTLTLSAKAKNVDATLTSQTGASATNRARNVFLPVCFRVLDVTQAITNSGALNISEHVTATGQGATAFARAAAGASHLFFQQASAAISNNSNVRAGAYSQSITNSGAIGLTIVASAKGNEPANGASADARGSAFFAQSANERSETAGTASQTISNSGTITVSESATVNTSGNRDFAAKAGMAWIFDQDASGEAGAAMPNPSPIPRR